MEVDDELVRLEIPAQPVFVGVARTVVTALAHTVDGLDEERVDDLRIAVSEACTNAVEAHQAEEVDERVVLRCLLAPGALEVRIEDSGPGFDPAALPTGFPSSDPDHRLETERGWGLQLMQALVDDVDFSTTNLGTAVRLRMRTS